MTYSGKNKQILSVKEITAVYNNTAQALSSVSLECAEGELTCILGPNGSGKSTLMTAVSGIHLPSLRITSPAGKNSITYNGIPVSSMNSTERAKTLSFLPQNEHYVWPYTVRDCVLMGRYAYSPITGIPSSRDQDIADEKISMLGIEHLSNKYIQEISGGELQRVYLARSLAQETPLMLFDEPFSHLDIYQQHRLLDFIKTLCAEHKKSAVITIHDINTAALFADNIILLSKGKITAQGCAEEVFTPGNLSLAYGCAFGLYKHPVSDRPQAYPIIK